MKSHLTSDYSLIIEQVGLDTIANKRAKIELVSTAGVLADTFLQNVLWALRMEHAKPRLRQTIVLSTELTQ